MVKRRSGTGSETTCSYGTRYLLTQTLAVKKEIPGVIAAENSEHIHRMRVAIRRFRTGLGLFSLCYPQKRIRSWRRIFRNTARVLGEARDTDVQIEFLNEYMACMKGSMPGVIETLIPGVEALLVHKTLYREQIQQKVDRAVRNMQKEGHIGDLEHYLTMQERKGKGSRRMLPGSFIAAIVAVSLCIDDLLSIGASLADPRKVREHHVTRIAVKRLRYTLEVWRDLSVNGFRNESEILRQLQDLLGELHDCDVWAGYLPSFLKEEEVRYRALSGNDGHFEAIVPGIEALARDRKERRDQVLGIALSRWQELASGNFWEELREKIPAIPAVMGQRPIRIGLTSIVSGDSDAMQMILADGAAKGIGLFLNAGGIPGIPSYTEETVRLIRKHGLICVAGRTDRDFFEGRVQRGDEEISQGKKGRRQSKQVRRFVKTLPSSLRLTLMGKRILLTNGLMDANGVPFTSEIPDKDLCRIARTAGVHIVISANPPHYGVREVCGTLFVHPDSVRSVDGETSPDTYAILEIGAEGRMTVTTQEISRDPE